MNEDLRKEIEEVRQNNQELSEDQKERLIEAIKEGDYNGEGLDVVCCRFKRGGFDETARTDRDTCINLLAGTVVADSNCQ